MITRSNLDKYYVDRMPYPKEYEPGEWVLSIVGNRYQSNNVIYDCIGYDPSCGFWMENENSKELINISERAIDRTFHKVRSKSNNEIYYKLYNSRDGYVTICCMQWFDEYDYDETRFISDSENNVLIFSSEKEAITYLNDNFDKEDIDPEYYRARKKSIDETAHYRCVI